MANIFQLILGGLDDAFALKNETRQKQGLPLLSEDPHEVATFQSFVVTLNKAQKR